MNEKTKIPIGWAATIILSVIGIAFNAGISQSRFSALEQDWAQYKLQSQEYEKTMRGHELKLQRLDIILDNISQKLDSIDRKLDRLDRKQDRK